MRNALTLVGIGAIVIVIGIFFAVHHPFSSSPDTSSITSTTTPMTSSFSLSSSAFEQNASIPSRFTCDGDRNLSPALSISGVPEGAKSLVLLVDDPDIPKVIKPDGVFDHWVLYDIPPETTEIPEGGSVGTVGSNGAGDKAYRGPCPPKEYEPSEHRYFFKLYALDAMLNLPPGASKSQVLEAMKGHMVAETQLIGKYKRP